MMDPFSNFALKPLLDLFKLGVDAINHLAPPSERCFKFMAPAVKKIEFLLIGHVFPACPSSHGEISRL